MTNHPARPAHPFIDPREMRDELTDLDALTVDLFGTGVPLRDRVATLVADWQDTDLLTIAMPDDAPPDDELTAAHMRQESRRLGV